MFKAHPTDQVKVRIHDFPVHPGSENLSAAWYEFILSVFTFPR